LSNPDLGYVKAGYREFRTWYDGSGGYFPLTQLWVSLYDEQLALDRGEVWFQAGLTKPKVPQISFEYRHQFRSGLKDSTIWGDTAVAGLAAPNDQRGLVPAFWRLDERTDLFAADVKHTLGKSDLGVGVRYEISQSDNSLNVQRRPDEIPASFFNRRQTQREAVDSDLFNAHAFTETRFSPKILFTTGYSFTTLDTDLSGDRVYGTDYEKVYDPALRLPPTYLGFTNLLGGSAMKQYVFTANLMATPWKHLYLVPSVRVEKNDLEGVSSFGITPLRAEMVSAASERGFVDISESLEARYAGITNWLFYARGYWLEGDGNLIEREAARTLGGYTFQQETDFDRFTQKYTAGANWYASKHVNFAVQYYHKRRENDYTHLRDTTPNTAASLSRYPAYIAANDFDTDDVNFRVTLRPGNALTLVSRYDFQLSTLRTALDQLGGLETAEQTTHIIGQTATWCPVARLYLQGGFNYVLDSTATPATDASPLAYNALNDYWNTTATAGYALSDKTDLQATYSYYRANNYQDNSAVTQPYGAEGNEHGVTATVAHRLRKNVLLTLRYGFFRGHDVTSGGFNNYEAHLVYSSIQYRF
jgi:hypothetical protein